VVRRLRRATTAAAAAAAAAAAISAHSAASTTARGSHSQIKINTRASGKYDTHFIILNQDGVNPINLTRVKG